MAGKDETVEGPVEHRALSAMGATFAERRAANEAAAKKRVSKSSTEDKAVSKSSTKTKS